MFADRSASDPQQGGPATMGASSFRPGPRPCLQKQSGGIFLSSPIKHLPSPLLTKENGGDGRYFDSGLAAGVAAGSAAGVAAAGAAAGATGAAAGVASPA